MVVVRKGGRFRPLPERVFFNFHPVLSSNISKQALTFFGRPSRLPLSYPRTQNYQRIFAGRSLKETQTCELILPSPPSFLLFVELTASLNFADLLSEPQHPLLPHSRQHAIRHSRHRSVLDPSFLADKLNSSSFPPLLSELTSLSRSPPLQAQPDLENLRSATRSSRTLSR